MSFQSALSAALNVSLHTLGRARGPKQQGNLRLEGLRASVEVLRDRWGVPHIYATDVHDLLFAQGFVHAQDRLWQMDFQRRVVAGRLAEVLGPAALPSDRGTRILGMRRVAEAEVALLNSETRAELAAYAAGVNACIARQPLPIEFTLLRYRPEPWTPADSLSWAKMMAWSLSANWETELLRAALIERLGPTLAAELEPPPPTRWPTVMPRQDAPGRPAERVDSPRPVAAADQRSISSRESPGGAAKDLDRAYKDSTDLPPSGSTLGSNNWVVAGWRSATGMPLLANDMHLLISAPAIWYENHLVVISQAEQAERSRRAVSPAQSKHAQRSATESDPSTALRSAQDDDAVGDLNVTGVTFPGTPYVVAGHNGHVAWGFTNGYPDVQDLYIERLRQTQDGQVQYEFRGAWLDAEVRREVIRVKGSEPITEEVIVTRHGPIINALAPGLAAPYLPTPPAASAVQDTPATAAALTSPLALRWTSLEPNTIIHALRAMNRACTCVEFRHALADWAAPVQNIVYADTQGNIAYSYPGRVPIRAQGDGRVPVPGWDGEHEWLGYVPFGELPHQFNPASGAISSANNRVADASFPYFLGSEFGMGDRAERIVDLLNSRPQVDPAFFRQMQLDQISSTLHTVAGYLGTLAVADPGLAPIVALVRRWNGRLTADSPAATVCEIFSRLMLKTILERRLGDLTDRALGRGPTPALREASLFSERTGEWLLHILTLPHSAWFDLGHGERRDDVMRIALRRTVAYLADRLGPAQPPDFEAWAWGRLHTITFAHIAGRVPELSRHLNRGPYPLGGDGNTLWATGNGLTPAAGAAVVGPPFRFIADLGDLDHCLGLLVPGNSGRPASPHYDDQINAWFAGDYHPMLYARQDVEHEAAARLMLRPLPRAREDQQDCQLYGKVGNPTLSLTPRHPPEQRNRSGHQQRGAGAFRPVRRPQQHAGHQQPHRNHAPG